MEDLKHILSEHPFFKGLNQEHLAIIVGCASNVRVDAGKMILHEGEEANQFYLIRSGKVSLQLMTPNKGPVTLETLDEGEILGWSWLLPPYAWHFDAKALELTRMIALDGKCLRTKCENDHHLGYELLKRFADIMMKRLESTRLQLMDIYGDRT
jgi:CRP/FNR family transcriptional regulator, cyclic AMP receptor protein